MLGGTTVSSGKYPKSMNFLDICGSERVRWDYEQNSLASLVYHGSQHCFRFSRSSGQYDGSRFYLQISGEIACNCMKCTQLGFSETGRIALWIVLSKLKLMMPLFINFIR